MAGKFILLTLFTLIAYFLLWPVQVEPLSWKAPKNPGYSGVFSQNNTLSDLELIHLEGFHGPEDIAIDTNGVLYASTREGYILRIDPVSQLIEPWVNTEGKPLGLDFDSVGNLVIADAYRGLLSISPQGSLTLLTNQAEGDSIRYADDLDIAANGVIYFSDASTKFGALDFKGSYEASLLDILEHGGHGRLLSFDPSTQRTAIELEGLNFANGVAISHDQQSVLINETGTYRVVRYWIAGHRKGQHEPFASEFPGFPDNISTGRDGQYWVALVSPRNALVDGLSDQPFMRKVIQRLPAFIRPEATNYGHVIALNEMGEVIENLQDPEGSYPKVTSVLETADYLYLGSLVTSDLARMPKE